MLKTYRYQNIHQGGGFNYETIPYAVAANFFNRDISQGFKHNCIQVYQDKRYYQD